MRKVALVLLLIVIGVVLAGVILSTVMARWQPLAQVTAATGSAIGTRDVIVQMTEEYLNFAVAREVAKLQDSRLTNVVVDVRPDALADVLVEGKLEMGPVGVSGKALLHTRIVVEKGRLLVSIQSIEVAGLNVAINLLPASARQSLAEATDIVNRSIENTLKRQGLVMQSFSTTQQAITAEMVRE